MEKRESPNVVLCTSFGNNTTDTLFVNFLCDLSQMLTSTRKAWRAFVLLLFNPPFSSSEKEDTGGKWETNNCCVKKICYIGKKKKTKEECYPIRFQLQKKRRAIKYFSNLSEKKKFAFWYYGCVVFSIMATVTKWEWVFSRQSTNVFYYYVWECQSFSSCLFLCYDTLFWITGCRWYNLWRLRCNKTGISFSSL